MLSFHRFALSYSPLLLGLSLTTLMLPAVPGKAQDTTQSTPKGQDPLAPYFYVLSRPLPTPHVVIDVEDAPDARNWAEHAQKLVEQWFPLVCQFLATDDWTPPKTIILTFKKDLEAPAYTTGAGESSARISINNKWITAHPDDMGMVIHEMTHVIQSYPDKGDKPGWLVEGIADYIRFWRYEPDVPRPRVNPQTATYHDSYRTTAAFLGWVTGKYNRSLVPRLDKALRTGTYSVNIFQEVTGKSVDTLWSEFVQTLPHPVPPR